MSTFIDSFLDKDWKVEEEGIEEGFGGIDGILGGGGDGYR